MIIIKNSILYFIQMRHTDDFPSRRRGGRRRRRRRRRKFYLKSNKIINITLANSLSHGLHTQ